MGYTPEVTFADIFKDRRIQAVVVAGAYGLMWSQSQQRWEIYHRSALLFHMKDSIGAEEQVTKMFIKLAKEANNE
jgi:hypothetical protein